jgi:hypothetical protein
MNSEFPAPQLRVSVMMFCMHPYTCEVLVFDYASFAKAHFDALRYFNEFSGKTPIRSDQCNTPDFFRLCS